MMICRRLFSLGILQIAFLVGGSSAQTTAIQSPPQPQTAVANTMSPSLRPLVRIRKLHLVRPDLIQYPISFEVYC
jgi:hypothetical protein